MSRAVQPVRSAGRWLRICSHLKVGKSPRKWSGTVCVPSGRWRLWNQGPSAAASSASDECTACNGSFMPARAANRVPYAGTGPRTFQLEVRVLDDAEDVTERIEHRGDAD